MTDRIVKLVANQGGPFTQTSNLVDFDIPADGTYDFSKSFVNLYARIDTVDTVAGGGSTGKAVYAINLMGAALTTDSTFNDNIHNICFVKNASLSTQLKGRLEDINRVDILRQNLNELTMSRADLMGLDHVAALSTKDVTNGVLGGLFRELHKEGTAKSRDLVAPIKIPLSQLFNLGSLQQYPASKLGKTRIHLELNVANFSPVAVGQTPDTAPATANFADVTRAATDPATLPVTSLTSNAGYPLLDQSPYFVGQRLQITSTKTDSAAATVERIVTGIAQSSANNTLTLTFDQAIDSLTGTQTLGTNKVFRYATPPAAAFSIDYAQLVLHKVAGAGKTPNVINYTTFSTEQAQGNGATNFQRQFQLEPNAVNVFLMFPAKRLNEAGNDTGLGSFSSANKTLRSARLRLDNEDLTNRDMQIATGDNTAHAGKALLLHDRLMMALMNGGYRLKNVGLTNLNRLAASPADQRTNGRRLTIVGNPVPVTPTEKLLQVNLAATATGVEDMILYKQLTQTLTI